MALKKRKSFVPVADIRPSSSRLAWGLHDDSNAHLEVPSNDSEVSRGLSNWYISPMHYTSQAPSAPTTVIRNKPFASAKAKDDMDTLEDLETLRATRVEELDVGTIMKPDKTALLQRLHVHSAHHSPYLSNLAHLKMERLRLEEAYLLKKKCETELERTRGPRPKWYELKTKEFHREANRNNFLIASKKEWQDIYTYRKSLDKALSRWSNLEI